MHSGSKGGKAVGALVARKVVGAGVNAQARGRQARLP